MSEDFPLPDTPVTTVKVPSGIFAVTFLRLWCVQPAMVRAWFVARGSWFVADCDLMFLRPVS